MSHLFAVKENLWDQGISYLIVGHFSDANYSCFSWFAQLLWCDKQKSRKSPFKNLKIKLSQKIPTIRYNYMIKDIIWQPIALFYNNPPFSFLTGSQPLSIRVLSRHKLSYAVTQQNTFTCLLACRFGFVVKNKWHTAFHYLYSYW